MMINENEKRKYARLNLKTRVSFSIEGSGKEEHHWEVAKGEDIGLRGIRFLHGSDIAVGTVLNLSLLLPYKSHPLKIKAIVRWCSQISDKEGYWVGAEFTAENETLKYLLLKYVCGNWGEDLSPIVY